MIFIKRLVMLVIHLLCMSIAIYSRPEVGMSLFTGIKDGTEEIDSVDITRYSIWLDEVDICMH